MGWFPCYLLSCTHLPRPYIEVLHRLGDIELVHCGDDDSRGGEEEEEDEEDHIDHEAADPPDEAPDGEVFPGRGEGRDQEGCVGKKGRSGASRTHHSPACVNSTWGASPRFCPSKSDQTSGSARLGFSRSNSVTRGADGKEDREGAPPFPPAGPAKPHRAAHQ